MVQGCFRGRGMVMAVVVVVVLDGEGRWYDECCCTGQKDVRSVRGVIWGRGMVVVWVVL